MRTSTNGVNTKQRNKAKLPVVPAGHKKLKRAFITLIESTPAAMALLDVMEYRSDQLEAMDAPGCWTTDDPFIVEFLRRIDCLFPSLLEQARAVEVLIEPRGNDDSP